MCQNETEGGRGETTYRHMKAMRNMLEKEAPLFY